MKSIELGYEVRKRKEKVERWIAWHIPHDIATWVFVRVVSHGTSGQWSNQVVPELTALDAMARWDKPNDGKIISVEALPKKSGMPPEGKQYEHNNSLGVTYYLNMKYVSLRGGRLVPIYYFSKEANRKEASPLPGGFKILENPRNGFLTVARPNTTLDAQEPQSHED